MARNRAAVAVFGVGVATLSACGAGQGCTYVTGLHDCLANAAEVTEFAKAPADLGAKHAARVLVSNYALLTRNAASSDLPRSEYLTAGIAPEATGVSGTFAIYSYTRQQNPHRWDSFHSDYDIEKVRHDGPDAAYVTVDIALRGVRPSDPARTDSYDVSTHHLRIERRAEGWLITGDDTNPGPVG